MNIKEIYPGTDLHEMPEVVEGLFNNLLIRSNFMASVRHKLGWRGLKYSCRNGRSWTCRIAAMDGVFGLHLFDTENYQDRYCCASIALYYFPDADEDIVEEYSIGAISMIINCDYKRVVRDFLCYPEFSEKFRIAELKLSLSHDKDKLACSLMAEKRLQIISEKGICFEKDGKKNYLVAPGCVDQDLPAFEMAFPLFEVFAATLSYNLDHSPSRLIYAETDITGSAAGKNCNQICLDYDHHYDANQYYGAYAVSDEMKILADWYPSKTGGKVFEDAGWWLENQAGSIIKDRGGKADVQKPELIILTGYLGSGKTTFLKNFIEYHTVNRRFVAVIQNELGETGLDGKLLEDNYAVLEMDEGCICCTLIGQLYRGIKNILENYNPDIIVLETTGLANPLNLLDEIEELGSLVKFEKLITLIDGVNFDRAAIQSSIVTDQLKASSDIIINKTDLMTPRQHKDIRQKIEKINADARINECSFGEINPALLAGKGEARKDDDTAVSTKMRQIRKTKKGHNHLEDHLGSTKITFNKSLDRASFLAAVRALPDTIYRIKGVIRFRDTRAQTMFQFVNGQSEFTEGQYMDENDNYLVFIGYTEDISKINTNLFTNNKINVL